MAQPKDTTQHRYSDRPFPPYRFIPGKTPHPTRDTEGHSYNKPAVHLASFDPVDWRSCEEYLYGIDLFNHGYWWEAHEALETVWVAAGRNSEPGQFIQGLIQIAVAHLKEFQGFHDVAKRMATDGLEKMKHIHSVFLGINIAVFRSDIKAHFSGKCESPVFIKLSTD